MKFEAVSTNSIGTANNGLHCPVDLHDQRRAPGGDLVALAPPSFFARRLIERDQERLLLVIPIDDQRIPVQRW